MRTKTLASLLILCGSTAAIAQITTEPQDSLTNNTVVNNTVDPADTGEKPDTAPANTTDDAPPQD
jgi:hypothetical protein